MDSLIVTFAPINLNKMESGIAIDCGQICYIIILNSSS